LIQELDHRGFPITAAFWAYDALLEAWRFTIAAPQGAVESLARAYRIIQDIIDENDLSITLDRISLIPDNDPKLANLQALAKSDALDVVEIPSGRTEIGGRVLDDIHLYRNDALRFEFEFVQTLRRILPADEQEHATIYTNAAEPLEVDAVLDDGQQLVIFEIKHLSRPVGAEVVFQVQGKRRQFETHFGRPVGAVIISYSGFTDGAKEAAPPSSRIRLVRWKGPQDDEKLLQPLTELRTRVK
jgi:Restriction endonuclease